MFLASNCTCAVYFTYTAHVRLLAKNMAATHAHAFAYAFAYAIKQTPYAFVAKIILCMYLLGGMPPPPPGKFLKFEPRKCHLRRSEHGILS